MSQEPTGVPVRRADVQGLRAVAVLAVVLNHAFPGRITGGYVGVDVFFVISGFVITGLIRRETAREGRFRFGRFYLRRVYRLMPALGVCVLVTLALTALLVSPIGIQSQAALTGLTADLWVSNFSLWYLASDYFSPQVQLNPFLHTWSLGVEEQFYLLFPVILVGASLLGTRRRRPVSVPAAVLVVLALGSFALCVVLTYGAVTWLRAPETFAFYAVFTRMWEFAVGALVALLLEHRHLAPRVLRQVAAVAGVVTVVLAVHRFTETTPFPGWLAAVPVLGTAAVIWAGPHTAVSRLLSTSVPVWFGDISYSLYLWHWPALVIGRRVLGTGMPAQAVLVLLSVAVAALSYRWVETPWRHRSDGPPVRRALAVSPFLVMPAAAAVLVGMASQHLWWSPTVRSAAEELIPRPVQYNICGGFAGPLSARDMSACTWGADRPGRPIYVVGDSNAQQYVEGLVTAAARLNRPLVIATRGGCPLIDAPHRATGGTDAVAMECDAWVQDARRWLAAQRPGTVVLAAAGEVISDRGVELLDADGRWTADPARKREIWRSGSLWGARAAAQRHQVLVLAPLPHLRGADRPWWHPAACPNSDWFQGRPQECSRAVGVAQVRASQADDLRITREMATATGSPYLDLTPQVCPGDTCHAYRDGHWWYRDGLHLSTYGSERLANPLAAALR